MPKLIKVVCHGPIGLSKKAKCPWEDVYLFWTGKPRKNKHYLAPCLCSKIDLSRELNSFSDNDFSGVSGEMFGKDVQGLIKDVDFSEEIKLLKRAWETISNNEMFIYDNNDGIPTVWTPKEFIDRQEAEIMIAKLMQTYGFNAIRCKWKRPKYISIPT